MPRSSGPGPRKAQPQGRGAPRTPSASHPGITERSRVLPPARSPVLQQPRRPRSSPSPMTKSPRYPQGPGPVSPGAEQRPEPSPEPGTALCRWRTSSGRGQAVQRRRRCPCSALLPAGPGCGAQGHGRSHEEVFAISFPSRGDFLSPLRSGAGERSLSFLPSRAALITEVCGEGGW